MPYPSLSFRGFRLLRLPSNSDAAFATINHRCGPRTRGEVTMSLEHLDPRVTKLYVQQIVALILVWIFTSFRAFARFLASRSLQLHDWLMFGSVVRSAVAPFQRFQRP